MSVFVICLYKYDNIKNILAAFETLEIAIAFCHSYRLAHDDEIEIQEWESDKKVCSYYANGRINPYES